MTEQPTILNPLDDEKRAIDLIARTPEGRLLHRYLRRVLEGVVDMPDNGALTSHNGRRTLARDLMRLMAQGIEDTSAARTGSTAATEPILARDRRPAIVSGQRRGAGRRVTADEPVAGWDDEPTSGS